jgi:hypothetical protein
MGFSDLFKPKWDRSDQAARLAAIERIGDREVLAKIATTGSFRDARAAALRKLIAVYYKNILGEYKLNTVAREVIEQIDDQVLLGALVKADIHNDLRKAAINNPNLTDQRLFSEVALSKQGWSIREAAISRLKDQSLLAGIAKNDPDFLARLEAVRSLTDQSHLARIASNDPYPSLREVAVSKLTDQSLLAEIEKTDPTEFVRVKALSMLTDLPLLLNLVKTSRDVSRFMSALAGLRKVAPEIAEKEIKAACSKEHWFTNFRNSERRCIRCGYGEICRQHDFGKWERDREPDDRDRYTWYRTCKICGTSEGTQIPPPGC